MFSVGGVVRLGTGRSFTHRDRRHRKLSRVDGLRERGCALVGEGPVADAPGWGALLVVGHRRADPLHRSSSSLASDSLGMLSKSRERLVGSW
jgi:hypothetical protein